MNAANGEPDGRPGADSSTPVTVTHLLDIAEADLWDITRNIHQGRLPDVSPGDLATDGLSREDWRALAERVEQLIVRYRHELADLSRQHNELASQRQLGSAAMTVAGRSGGHVLDRRG